MPRRDPVGRNPVAGIQPTTASPSTQPAATARNVDTSGPGTAARPSSSKAIEASAHVKPSARRENTPVSARSSHIPASKPSRTRTEVNRPWHTARMPSRSASWSSVRSKCIVVPLAYSPTGHGRSRGRPSTRSLKMFRWICEVPAAIVSDSVRSRSST